MPYVPPLQISQLPGQPQGGQPQQPVIPGATPGQPSQGVQSNKGPTIDFNQLMAGGNDFFNSQIKAANENPYFQQQGISFAADPTHIGHVIQIQGQTQLQQTQTSLNIQKSKNTLGQNPDALLSVTEARDLGVPYGTTKGEAQKENIVPSTPATAEKVTAQTKSFEIAQEGIKNLSDAISRVNWGGGKFDLGYLPHVAKIAIQNAEGNNNDIQVLRNTLPDVLEALKSLTNTGRITQQEINTVGDISPYATEVEAMGKINQYKALLAKAIDLNAQGKPVAQAGSGTASDQQPPDVTSNVDDYLNSLGITP